VDEFPSLKARRLLAFHDRQELMPRDVRKVLVKEVGLAEAEALRLL
jgi:hypothetical protein